MKKRQILKLSKTANNQKTNRSITHMTKHEQPTELIQKFTNEFGDIVMLALDHNIEGLYAVYLASLSTTLRLIVSLQKLYGSKPGANILEEDFFIGGLIQKLLEERGINLIINKIGEKNG